MVAGVKTFALGSKYKRQLSTQGRHQGKSPVDHYRDLRSRQGISIQKSYETPLLKITQSNVSSE